MQYQDIKPISREQAEQAFASNVESSLIDALLRSAYHNEDWRWVQGKCLVYAQHPSCLVRQIAIQSLGHLARLHGKLDMNLVMPVLLDLKKDSTLLGFVDDALDDIQMFIKESPELPKI